MSQLNQSSLQLTQPQQTQPTEKQSTNKKQYRRRGNQGRAQPQEGTTRITKKYVEVYENGKFMLSDPRLYTSPMVFLPITDVIGSCPTQYNDTTSLEDVPYEVMTTQGIILEIIKVSTSLFQPTSENTDIVELYSYFLHTVIHHLYLFVKHYSHAAVVSTNHPTLAMINHMFQVKTSYCHQAFVGLLNSSMPLYNTFQANWFDNIGRAVASITYFIELQNAITTTPRDQLIQLATTYFGNPLQSPLIHSIINIINFEGCYVPLSFDLQSTSYGAYYTVKATRVYNISISTEAINDLLIKTSIMNGYHPYTTVLRNPRYVVLHNKNGGYNLTAKPTDGKQLSLITKFVTTVETNIKFYIQEDQQSMDGWKKLQQIPHLKKRSITTIHGTTNTTTFNLDKMNEFIDSTMCSIFNTFSDQFKQGTFSKTEMDLCVTKFKDEFRDKHHNYFEQEVKEVKEIKKPKPPRQSESSFDLHAGTHTHQLPNGVITKRATDFKKVGDFSIDEKIAQPFVDDESLLKLWYDSSASHIVRDDSLFRAWVKANKLSEKFKKTLK